MQMVRFLPTPQMVFLFMTLVSVMFLMCDTARAHPADYWTQIDAKCKNVTTNVTTSIVDLWDTNTEGRKYNNSWNCSQSNQPASCVYEDEVRALLGVPRKAAQWWICYIL
jgi:hypothetical protein